MLLYPVFKFGPQYYISHIANVSSFSPLSNFILRQMLQFPFPPLDKLKGRQRFWLSKMPGTAVKALVCCACSSFL